MNDTTKPNKPAVTGRLVVFRKAEALQSNAKEQEDIFQSYYVGAGEQSKSIVEPPYSIEALRTAVQENNALPSCVAAMEVNIDGTGWEVLPLLPDAAEAEFEEAKKVSEFFNEPYPGTTFTALRREVRVDAEETGWGLIEVIRSATDEITFLRRMSPELTRLVSLDDPVTVTKKVLRNGKPVDVRVMVRERRFAQILGTKIVYFREFGASRDLNKETGVWANAGERLPATLRATEVLVVGIRRDSKGPYYVPRWINNTPSVVGSRKAEELNLDFFDNGGIPPVVVVVAGGEMTEDSKTAIQNAMQRKKGDAAYSVLEVTPTTGGLEATGSVNVTFERFGSESQNDSMFEGYDEKCEKRVRRSFRLPPLFVGKTEDFSYATAFASYSVAEEQVFAPERVLFDDLITATLLRDPSLGGGRFKLRSKPLTVKDIQSRLAGLTLLATKSAISNEELVAQINSQMGMDVEWNGEEGPSASDILASLMSAGQNGDPTDTTDGDQGGGGTGEEGDDLPDGTVPPGGAKQPAQALKGDGRRNVTDSLKLLELSKRVAKVLVSKGDGTEAAAVDKAVKSLSKADRRLVSALAAQHLLFNAGDGEATSLLKVEAGGHKCDHE